MKSSMKAGMKTRDDAAAVRYKALGSVAGEDLARDNLRALHTLWLDEERLLLNGAGGRSLTKTGKNCRRCHGEHDPQFHRVTVGLHRWFREKVVQAITVIEPGPRGVGRRQDNVPRVPEARQE